MLKILVKAAGMWALLVIIAIINGILREELLMPILGMRAALPASGILLSVLIFIAAYLLIPIIGKSHGYVYTAVGAIWFFMTLSFEFLFGYYALNKSFPEIMTVFNIMEGNLFALALMTSAAAPWLAAKIRGYA